MTSSAEGLDVPQAVCHNTHREPIKYIAPRLIQRFMKQRHVKFAFFDHYDSALHKRYLKLKMKCDELYENHIEIHSYVNFSARRKWYRRRRRFSTYFVGGGVCRREPKIGGAPA